MKAKIIRDIGLFMLAVIFSIGLMFAFLELPILLDKWLQSVLNTPHTDPTYDAFRIELFYDAYAIRYLGYLSLASIIILIILGFVTRKTFLTWIGGVAMFLPVFATFAYSMFYLAGLGIFNVIIFPFLDISTSTIDMGKAALIPYWTLLWIFSLFHWDAHTALVYIFMITGALIFVLGVFTWFQARSGKRKVAMNWLYKYSRHPQYLGWIIWSYGLMLYGPSINDMKKSWGWQGTLPWLLSTMVIIGICMLEELKMKEKAGKEYDSYREKTPFLIPLPRFLAWLLNLPLRIFFRKKRVERRREIGALIGFYTFLLLALSFFWMEFPKQEEHHELLDTNYSQSKVDSLLYEIHKPQSRRERSLAPFHELLAMGSKTYPELIEMIQDDHQEVREFAIGAASRYNVEEAIPAIMTALHDSIDRNKRQAIRALGQMHYAGAIDTLMFFLENNVEGYRQDVLLTSLTNLECKKIIPYLEKKLENAVWYSWSATIKNLLKLDHDLALGHLYQGLENKDPLRRREAVYIILDILPKDAIPQLEKVLDDNQWEVRFYAKQACQLISEKG